MKLSTELLAKLNKVSIAVDKVHRFIEYLRYFGYLVKDGDLSLDEIVAAIRKLQAHAGVEQDGELDQKTLGLMDWPRCGCAEGVVEDATNPAKWGLSELTYFIKGRDTDLPTNVWDSIIAKAFSNWEQVCALRFKQVNNEANANLVITVGQGAKDNFDGPSGTLAWAYLPSSSNFRGQLLMKFDVSETWVEADSPRGIRMVNVATHEFGHMLGLTHSQISTALMAPFYSPQIATPQASDDIPRIQALYGPATIPADPSPTNPPVTPPSVPSKETVITIKGNVDSIQINGYRVSKMS